jgi:hypothetical protein
LRWIRLGSLPAFNAASRLGKRPRWLIDLADVEQFEKARSNQVDSPAPKRRRQQSDDYRHFEY